MLVPILDCLTGLYAGFAIFTVLGYMSISKCAQQFQDVVAETATFVLEKQNIFNEQIKVEFYQLSKKYLENYQSQSSFL